MYLWNGPEILQGSLMSIFIFKKKAHNENKNRQNHVSDVKWMAVPSDIQKLRNG